jgi:hypothetical protein
MKSGVSSNRVARTPKSKRRPAFNADNIPTFMLPYMGPTVE